MQKLRQKLSYSTIILLIGICLTSLALGAVIINKELNNTITVIKQGTIELYQDEQCSIIIDTLPWGDGVTQGSTITRSIWIKNIGSTIVYVTWDNTALPDTQCTLTLARHLTDGTYVQWNKGIKVIMDSTWWVEVVLTLHIDSNTIPNSYSWIVTFTASDS